MEKASERKWGIRMKTWNTFIETTLEWMKTW